MLRIAADNWARPLVAVADGMLLRERAAALRIPVKLREYVAGQPLGAERGVLHVAHEPLAMPATPGRLDRRNVPGVLAALRRACNGCLAGEFAALVTAPVQKSVINEAGVAFTGHTEFLAALCNVPRPVMMLVAGELRVALATTHLPLADVPASLSAPLLRETLAIVDRDLRGKFGIERPRMLVLGLNPHAGEAGHLGREEQELIGPALQTLRGEGLDLRGPAPADTAFTPASLAGIDAVLAMYHDQGLPVLKALGFGHAVNVTLGLPIIRTSVDHGTALDLAGTGRADAGSLRAAVELALVLCGRAAR